MGTRLRCSKYNLVREVQDGLEIRNLVTSSKVILTEDAYKEQWLKLQQAGVVAEELDPRFQSTGLAVPEDADELALTRALAYRRMWNPYTLTLVILPTRDCNFSCTYCYEEHEPLHMTDEVLDDLTRAVESHYAQTAFRNLEISWFGGEPLLRWGTIMRFYDWATGFCRSNDIHLGGAITTNGYHLSEDRFRQLLHHGVRRYQITVDGTAETHDQLRKLRSGKATWARVWKNLTTMHRTDDDFEVRLRVNYNLEVLEAVPAFLDLVKDHLDDRFKVSFHGIRDLGGPCADSAIDIATESVAIPLLMDEVWNRGLKEGMLDTFRHMGTTCYAAFPYILVVDYDGTLRKCTVAIDKEFNNVGTIRGGQWHLDQHRYAKWILPPITLSEKGCFDCTIYPMCNGISCPLPMVSGAKTEPICPLEVNTVYDLFEVTEEQDV